MRTFVSPRLLGAVLAAGSVALLAACGSEPSPLLNEKTRAGAEQSVAPTSALPRAAGTRQYDPGTSAQNEERGLKVGTTVQTTGGQEAQKQKQEKEQLRAEEDQAKKADQLDRAKRPDERTTSP